jgi:type IV pilus assembly protein PilM
VLAAALTGAGKAHAYAFAPLAAGALVPGIGETNVRAPESVADAIRKTLDEVSPRTRAVTLILPDTAIRVFVLDFDSLPARTAEVVPVLRFRLRKMVPFDVEHAAVSYQVLPGSKTECRVLTAVIPGSILAEYEGAVRTAGYEPGTVLSSGLATLASLDTAEPVLAACLSQSALTTSITNGHDLLLYRTLELPLEPGQQLADVQRGIAVAAAFFEDKLGVRPHRLHFAGTGTAQEFARWINDPELVVDELVSRPETGALTPLGNMSVAGITGALAGAA